MLPAPLATKERRDAHHMKEAPGVLEGVGEVHREAEGHGRMNQPETKKRPPEGGRISEQHIFKDLIVC